MSDLKAPPTCMATGCTKPPRWQVCAKLFAVGWPRAKRRRDEGSAMMTSGLVLCDDHRKTFNKAAFFTQSGRDQIAACFISRGKAPPDFDTAEIEFRMLAADGMLHMERGPQIAKVPVRSQ